LLGETRRSSIIDIAFFSCDSITEAGTLIRRAREPNPSRAEGIRFTHLEDSSAGTIAIERILAWIDVPSASIRVPDLREEST